MTRNQEIPAAPVLSVEAVDHDRSYGSWPPPPSVESPSTRFANTALVLGIVGLVLFWVVVVGPIFGILAVVFGAVSVNRANQLDTARGRAWAGIVTGSVAVAAGVTTSAFVLATTGDTEARSELVMARSLQPGQCFDPPDGGPEPRPVALVRVMSCSEPHESETYHRFQLPDGRFPGEARVLQAAMEGCRDEFQGFVGSSYERSDLDIFVLYPLERNWAKQGDRHVICSVYDVNFAKLRGSMEGTGR